MHVKVVWKQAKSMCFITRCDMPFCSQQCWFCLKPLCTFSWVNPVKAPNIRYFLLSPEELPLTSSSTFYHQVPQMLLLCVSPCLELGCISPGVKGRDQRWPPCSWPENLDQRCGHVEANRRALGWNRAEKTKRERERQTDRQTEKQVCVSLAFSFHVTHVYDPSTETILLLFTLHPSPAFRTLLLTMRTTPFLLRDSCPQYFVHLMWRANSLEKLLMLGKLRAGGEGGDRGRDGWMASSIQWTWVWASSRRQWRTEETVMRLPTRWQRVR